MSRGIEAALVLVVVSALAGCADPEPNAPAPGSPDLADDSTSPSSRASTAAVVVVTVGVTAATAGAAVGAVYLARRDENWLRRFLGLILPLFTRIAKPQVLGHESRERVHAAIRERPGIHIAALQSTLQLNSGTLLHHLRTLERHRLVTSRREGRFRRYYPGDAAVPPVSPSPLSVVAQRILDELERSGETAFTEMADRLGVSKQRLSYNVKVLRARGLVELVPSGDGARWVVRRVKPR